MYIHVHVHVCLIHYLVNTVYFHSVNIIRTFESTYERWSGKTVSLVINDTL